VKLSRPGDRTSETAGASQFNGTVWTEELADSGPLVRLHVARVTFAPGARTAWHTHPRGQILLAEAGVGRVQRDGAPAETLRPGDTVVIEPGERHWHGAGPGHVFVHVAMQAATEDSGQAVWQEHVTDAEYSRA
jgi:quercetin dioxygenase-like cupin family protein